MGNMNLKVNRLPLITTYYYYYSVQTRGMVILDTKLKEILKELEGFGKENDAIETDRSKRMRNVTPETGQFLSFMVSITKAKSILEIGTSNGYSTLWLSDGTLGNGEIITTIEFSSEKAQLAKENFVKANLEKQINLVVTDAGEYIKEIEPNSVDFIFLDSDRKEYIDWWGDLRSCLKRNAIMIVDNITSHESELQEFVHLVSTDEHVTSMQLPLGCGLLLVKKNTDLSNEVDE